MTETEVRCVALVRKAPGRLYQPCRKKLATMVGPVSVNISDETRTGCVVIYCPRCGSPNQVCPKEEGVAA